MPNCGEKVENNFSNSDIYINKSLSIVYKQNKKRTFNLKKVLNYNNYKIDNLSIFLL